MAVLIAILTAVAVIAVGGAIMVARSERAARVAARMGAGAMIAESPDGRKEQFVATLDRVGQMVSSGETSRNLKEELAAAGFYSSAASAAFLGAKVLLLILGIIIAMMVGVGFNLSLRSIMFLAAFLCAGLFFLPNII